MRNHKKQVNKDWQFMFNVQNYYFKKRKAFWLVYVSPVVWELCVEEGVFFIYLLTLFLSMLYSYVLWSGPSQTWLQCVHCQTPKLDYFQFLKKGHYFIWKS